MFPHLTTPLGNDELAREASYLQREITVQQQRLDACLTRLPKHEKKVLMNRINRRVLAAMTQVANEETTRGDGPSHS